ncbi:uncharacterized protein THITE_2129533 [Thermothielavioides terrestris NRRL 8126]|uniref:Uncharacterized protein n=1 Tax=Thermothielavioides terrestris (strain ATCC 38088 / NRRL 8126) TaxID=578455 RepID=G2R6P7_THETT|nr:uncharacterized protein THITE_2129533 [Thermothielavioides terrestris NRRL 8126]AEO67679.1 hypothetical protein THITE_2129533 [Thermothielavioides terrestris NRRL 8126]
MHPFPVWPGVPFLWEQYRCDCYKYFQFYLCGCPDLTIAKSGRPPEHQPSIRRCAMWYKPEWEQRQAASYRFEHKPDWDLPFKEPQVLPFPCYHHWNQSRIFLDPSALGDLGRRLDNPATNPPRAARWNRNIRALQHFQEQGRTWELKKRVREVLDDPSQRPCKLRKRAADDSETEALRPRFHALALDDRLRDSLQEGIGSADQTLAAYPSPPTSGPSSSGDESGYHSASPSHPAPPPGGNSCNGSGPDSGRRKFAAHVEDASSTESSPRLESDTYSASPLQPVSPSHRANPPDGSYRNGSGPGSGSRNIYAAYVEDASSTESSPGQEGDIYSASPLPTCPPDASFLHWAWLRFSNRMFAAGDLWGEGGQIPPSGVSETGIPSPSSSRSRSSDQSSGASPAASDLAAPPNPQQLPTPEESSRDASASEPSASEESASESSSPTPPASPLPPPPGTPCPSQPEDNHTPPSPPPASPPCPSPPTPPPPSPPSPAAPANQPYTNPLFAYFSIPPAKNQSHFSSLTWLLEEQHVDLWALDGYRWLQPQPQQQWPCAPRFDGNTHRGYAGGAYRFDLETLGLIRWANWHKWDKKGRWARAVGDWFSMGGWAVEEGGLLGAPLSME